VLAVTPAALLITMPAGADRWVSAVLATAVMLTFLMAFMSPRRHDAAVIIGASLMAGLMAATGAAGLVLLYDLAAPVRAAGTLLVIGVTDAAVIAVGTRSASSRTGRRALAALLTAALAASVVVMLDAVPPPPGWAAVGVATAAVVAALAGGPLREALRRAGGDEAPRAALLVGTADAVLIATPVAVGWVALLRIDGV
jgi:peptidoglycan/LPS O-acetylase OafA/YrhL